MRLLPFLNRHPQERRTGRFKLVKHEIKGGGWRIVRVRDGKPVGVISELRRASDLADGLNLVAEHNLDLDKMPLPEWQIKIRRIEQMIAERKEAWVYVGKVEDAA